MSEFPFSLSDLQALAPELLLTAFAFIALVPDLFARKRTRTAGHLSIFMAVAALAVVVWMWSQGRGLEPVMAFSGTFVLDRFSLFFKVAFLLSAILAMGLSVRLLDHDRVQTGEYYSLILFATVGMMFMASGLDLLVIWLGLELMSLASYVLCGYARFNRKSSEAALKYFLLGAFSSGVLLYGMSLIYGSMGTTLLPAIRQALENGTEPGAMLNLGVILLVAGFGFKIAAVPFHQWAPDVYEGAPTGVTAFISTASKGAAFAALLRILAGGFGTAAMAELWVPLLVVLAAASMIFGNIAALLQDNVKRMLAYSSIGHAGFMLMGLIAAGSEKLGAGQTALGSGSGDLYGFAVASVLIYVLVYTFTNVGAFGVVAVLREPDEAGDRLEAFKGLSARSPLLAFSMLVFLLSLAGIPLTAGFIGKWYLFGAAVSADYAWLAVVAVLMTAVSVYYYLRVVVAMYMTPAQSDRPIALSGTLAAALMVALFFTLLIGVYPARFLDLAAEGATHILSAVWRG